MINFTLNSIDDTPAWGTPPNMRLHWWALTLGQIYFEFDKTKIFEYSPEAKDFFGNPNEYCEYQIAAIIEDFSNLFEKIGESIPEDLFSLTENLLLFLSRSEKWLNKNDGEEFYFSSYEPLRSWIDQRELNCNYFTQSPKIYFFRHDDILRAVWEISGKLENGANMWAAQSGQFQMPYREFVRKIKNFRDLFFENMGEKIHHIINADLGKIDINEDDLLKEHSEKANIFSEKLHLLEDESNIQSNWTEVRSKYKNMVIELS